MMTLPTELQHLINVLKFGLVYLQSGSKFPKTSGWQNTPIVCVEEAEKIWRRGGNLGINHAASGTTMVDIDHLEWARLALMAVSIDLDALLVAPGPKIRSAKGLKPLYRLPEGLELNRKVLTWHEPGAAKPTTVFELRAGKVQDVLPPSIHPDTGKPYLWEPARPESRDEIPVLPDSLRMLWENWDMFRDTLIAAQPWFKEVSNAQHVQQPPGNGGKSVIASFNAQNDSATLLTNYGYKPMGQNRYLSPSSSTGTPGIVILDSDKGQRIFCHHASDPLCGENGHDAFSAWTVLEHNGDVSAAVKAAAGQLGMTLTAIERVLNSGQKVSTVAADFDPEAPWDMRLRLPALHPPVLPLPPEFIPGRLRPWLVDIAERASLPLEFVACPALVALSTVVGRKVGIRPKRLDDWVVVPNLWGGIVGKPGVMKSAAISEPTKPLSALAKRARECYEMEAEKAEAERVRLELEISALKENEKRAAKGRYKSE